MRKFQDNLRIAVQLIDVESARQLWAGSFKGTLADVFDIQEQVSKQIVEALMVKLTPTEKTVLTKRTTVNAEAFDCNLRARDFMNRRTKTSVNMAVQFFQKAIELDPRYASAYAGLGECYGTLYRDFDRKEMWLDRALEASLKAIMYDATLSEAYASLAIAYFGKKSLGEALEASQKAILLDPKNSNDTTPTRRGLTSPASDRFLSVSDRRVRRSHTGLTGLHFCLLRDLQSIVDVDPEIPDRAFKLRVP